MRIVMSLLSVWKHLQRKQRWVLDSSLPQSSVSLLILYWLEGEEDNHVDESEKVWLREREKSSWVSIGTVVWLGKERGTSLALLLRSTSSHHRHFIPFLSLTMCLLFRREREKSCQQYRRIVDSCASDGTSSSLFCNSASTVQRTRQIVLCSLCVWVLWKRFLRFVFFRSLLRSQSPLLSVSQCHCRLHFSLHFSFFWRFLLLLTSSSSSSLSLLAIPFKRGYYK